MSEREPDPPVPSSEPEPREGAILPEAAPAAEAHAMNEPEPAAVTGPRVEAPPAPPIAPPIAPSRPRIGPLDERPEEVAVIPRARLRAHTRRDFLLFGAGALAAAVVGWWLLPDSTRRQWAPGVPHDRLDTLAARVGLSRANRDRVLNGALSFDDDVAEALYSKDRRVRTYRHSDVTPLRNNYHGQTPGPEFLATWTLNLSGLASGGEQRFALLDLVARFPHVEQVTRLVCVEGWSAVAWWGGIRFADLLAAFPPNAGTRWAAMRSSVVLDSHGNVEPYYVSIDLATAMHPQTLLATHQNGRPLSLAHGAPLRLLAPVKLGLKNIKAVTDIVYTVDEPPDYWNERGYSKYDGL